MSLRWTEIRYKCRCLSKEATFQMLERDVEEDVLDFTERMRNALAVDHRKRSPLCEADKVEYCKIPIEGEIIGGAKGGTA